MRGNPARPDAGFFQFYPVFWARLQGPVFAAKVTCCASFKQTESQATGKTFKLCFIWREFQFEMRRQAFLDFSAEPLIQTRLRGVLLMRLSILPANQFGGWGQPMRAFDQLGDRSVVPDDLGVTVQGQCRFTGA